MAVGFSQQHGVDYRNTFAPTVTLNVTGVLMAITNDRYLHLHAIDVKTAFLRAPLEEECYMAIPQGAGPPKGEGVDCVRLKAGYGLKQAPEEWHSTFVMYLFELGFKRLYTDISVFMHGKEEKTIIISVHVDDTNIMSASLKRVLRLKCHLQKKFGIVDDGPTSYFLGIQVVRDMEGRVLELHRQKYIRKINAHN